MLRVLLLASASAAVTAYAVPKGGFDKLYDNREEIEQDFFAFPFTDCSTGADDTRYFSLNPDETVGFHLIMMNLEVDHFDNDDFDAAVCAALCFFEHDCYGFTVDRHNRACLLHEGPPSSDDGINVNFDITRECFIWTTKYDGLANFYLQGVSDRYGEAVFEALNSDETSVQEYASLLYGEYIATRYHSCGPTFGAGELVPAVSNVQSDGLPDGAVCVLECRTTPGCNAVSIDYSTSTCSLVISNSDSSSSTSDVVYSFDAMSMCLEITDAFDASRVQFSSNHTQEGGHWVFLPYVDASHNAQTSILGASSPYWGTLEQCKQVCGHIDDCYAVVVANQDCDAGFVASEPGCYIQTLAGISTSDAVVNEVHFEASECRHTYGKALDADSYVENPHFDLDSQLVFSYSIADTIGYNRLEESGFVIHDNSDCDGGPDGLSVTYNPPSSSEDVFQDCVTACSRSPNCIAVTAIHDGTDAGQCKLRFAPENATFHYLVEGIPIANRYYVDQTTGNVRENLLHVYADAGRTCYSKCLKQQDERCTQYDISTAVFGPAVTHHGVDCWVDDGVSMPVEVELADETDVEACREACAMYETCQAFVVNRDELKCVLRFVPSYEDWTEFMVQESPNLNRDCHFKLSQQIEDVVTSLNAGQYRVYDNVNCWTAEGGHSVSVPEAMTVEECTMRCDYSHECLGFVFLKNNDNYIDLGKCHLRYGSKNVPVFLQYSPSATRQCHVKMNSPYGPGSDYWDAFAADLSNEFSVNQYTDCWVQGGEDEFAGSEIEICVDMCKAREDCHMCIYDKNSYAAYMRLAPPSVNESSVNQPVVEIRVDDARECHSKTDITGWSGQASSVISRHSGGLASSKFFVREDDRSCSVEGGESMYVSGASLGECLDVCYYASHIIAPLDPQSECLAVLFVKSTQKCYLRLAGEQQADAVLTEEVHSDRICYRRSLDETLFGECSLEVDFDSVGLPVAAARPACEQCSSYDENVSFVDCSNAIVDLCYADGFGSDAPVCEKPQVPCIFEEHEIAASMFAYDHAGQNSPYASPCFASECDSNSVDFSVDECQNKVSEFCALSALARYRLGPYFEVSEGCEAVFYGVGFDSTKTLGDKYRTLFCPVGWEPENIAGDWKWTQLVSILKYQFNHYGVDFDLESTLHGLENLQAQGRMAEYVDPCDFESFLMMFVSLHQDLEVSTINECGHGDSMHLHELGTTEEVFTHVLMAMGGLTMEQGFAAIGSLAGYFYCHVVVGNSFDNNCEKYRAIFFNTFDAVRLASVTTLDEYAASQIDSVSIAYDSSVDHLWGLVISQDLEYEQLTTTYGTIIEHLVDATSILGEHASITSYDSIERRLDIIEGIRGALELVMELEGLANLFEGTVQDFETTQETYELEIDALRYELEYIYYLAFVYEDIALAYATSSWTSIHHQTQMQNLVDELIRAYSELSTRYLELLADAAIPEYFWDLQEEVDMNSNIREKSHDESLNEELENYVAGIESYVFLYRAFVDQFDYVIDAQDDDEFSESYLETMNALAWFEDYVESALPAMSQILADGDNSVEGLVMASENALSDMFQRRQDLLEHMGSVLSSITEIWDHTTAVLEDYAVDGMLGSLDRTRESLERFYVPDGSIEVLLDAANEQLLLSTIHSEDGDDDDTEVAQQERCFASAGILFGVAEMMYLNTTDTAVGAIMMSQDASFLEDVAYTLGEI